MVHSPLTNEIAYSRHMEPRGHLNITKIVDHHGATTNLRPMLNGPRVVSANYYILNSGWIICLRGEEYRSYSLSSARHDGDAITWEVENERLGEPWTRSAAAQRSVERLTADIAERYKWPDIVRRVNYFGHREIYEIYGASYATACPGGAPLDQQVINARAIRAGTATATPTTPESEEDDDMIRFTQTGEDGTIWINTANGSAKIRSFEDYKILQAFASAKGVLPADYKKQFVIQSYLHAASTNTNSTPETILKAIDRIPELDQGMLVEAIKIAAEQLGVEAGQRPALAAKAIESLGELQQIAAAPNGEPA